MTIQESGAALVGASPWSVAMRAEIDRLANFDATVLITGETGTGKEMLARQIHSQGARSESPFIPVDCTGISGTLFASQLFGHRKGAFTGALYEALGCFRAADGGVILLDEIGELELPLQAKLLRVLQEQTVVPVGSHDPVPIDVRVLAATNRDLRQEVAAGRFREDLYFRLAVVTLEAQALRNRRGDISALCDHFLAMLSAKHGLPTCRLSPGAVEGLECFDWPGNVRQLQHVLEQLVITATGPLINLPLVQQVLARVAMPQPAASINQPAASINQPAASINRPAAMMYRPASPADLQAYRQGTAAGYEPHSENRQPAADRSMYDGRPSPLPEPAPPVSNGSPGRGWKTLDDLERQHIQFTLEHTYYNQSAAARMLGITRQALGRRMEKYGLQPLADRPAHRPR